MKKNSISVIVTTYNGKDHIIQQLESINNQSRKADEVLIYDDRSTDETVSLVSEFIKHYNLKNWSLVVNEKNMGYGSNFMHGIFTAAGDIVFPCDQDDIWEANKLEYMENVLNNHSEVELLTSNYYALFQNKETSILPRKDSGDFEQIPLSNNIMYVTYAGCTYAIRRSLIEVLRGYYKEGWPHDATFWRIGLLRGTVYSVKKPLIRRRFYQESTSAKDAKGLKSEGGRRAWVSYATSVIEMLDGYVRNEYCFDKNKALKVIRRNKKWCKIRMDFFDTKNILSGIRCAEYIDLYPNRFKSYIGDWYVILFRK